MEIGYVGGIVERDSGASSATLDWVASADWSTTYRDKRYFLLARGHHCRLVERGTCAILISGQCFLSGGRRANAPEDVGELLLNRRERDGRPTFDGLEGSFTVVAVDAENERVCIYRNLFGNAYTYYFGNERAFLCSSNLRELFDVGGVEPQLNRDVLPAYFLNRHAPGRSTLFRNCQRALPGERITGRIGRIERSQVETYADVPTTPIANRALIDRLDERLGAVLTDCAASRERVANLLSGGVDSSLIQAHWNNVPSQRERRKVSACVAVDHPNLKLETEYALSAAHELGTEHLVHTANAPVGDYLHSTIQATAEPPNHVQIVYYQELAEAMALAGHTTALCGEGADSSFGFGQTSLLQNALFLRRALPSPALRSLGALLAGKVKRTSLRTAFQIANLLGNDRDWKHPVNETVTFANWRAVAECFGPTAIDEAITDRHNLLDDYRVPRTLLDRVHATGFLVSSINVCGLQSVLLNTKGIDLVSPFFDSRIFSYVQSLRRSQRFPYRNPKALLKQSLARAASPHLAYRRKLSFGQPIFEWMGRGGQLESLVGDIDDYGFVPQDLLAREKANPSWFLFSLLCFDLWHKSFIRRSPFVSDDAHRSSHGLRQAPRSVGTGIAS